MMLGNVMLASLHKDAAKRLFHLEYDLWAVDNCTGFMEWWDKCESKKIYDMLMADASTREGWE